MNSTRLRSERSGTLSKRPAIAIESAMREIAPFAKSKFRVANPIYRHTLAPNFAGEDARVREDFGRDEPPDKRTDHLADSEHHISGAPYVFGSSRERPAVGFMAGSRQAPRPLMVERKLLRLSGDDGRDTAPLRRR
jgi:hypothetical protein